MTKHSRIPTARYVSPSWMEREHAELWPRTWLLAGHGSKLAAPGSYLVLDHGRASYLVLRDQAGVARAFHNVCRHRGTRLCDSESGTAEMLRCPYHGWTWDRSGELVGIPDGSGCDAEVLADAALAAVRCEERHGFVWISARSDIEPIAAWLGPVDALIAAYGLADWQLASDVTVDLPCNWKTSVDAQNEAYHVQALHPELLPLIDDSAVEIECLGRHSTIRVPFGRPSPRASRATAGQQLLRWAGTQGIDLPATDEPAALRRRLQAALRERLADVPGIDALTDAQLTDTHQFHVFPNTQLLIRARELLLFRHRPHASEPQRMQLDKQTFVRGVEAPIPPVQRTLVRYGDHDLGPVIDADLEIAVRQQRGLASGGLEAMPLSEQERCIRHMHETLDGFLR